MQKNLNESKVNKQSQHHIDDIRIREIKELCSPSSLLKEFPCEESSSSFIVQSRHTIQKILRNEDDRLIVIVGPCSIHDCNAAIEYSQRLLLERQRFFDDLEIVMRVYFEKPRTTVGWKGLINDPHLDNSFDISEGLRIARQLLLRINQQGMPAGTEFLDMISPQYIADLVSWGAIGARTTESQVHRELASGLSCPVGFKNGTDGNLKIAIDAIQAASQPHHFLSVTKGGRAAIVSTKGNKDCHIILRGGKEPNYDQKNVVSASESLKKSGLHPSLMIDYSHANSKKNFLNQHLVNDDVCGQITKGEQAITGVMIESHLVEGRQDILSDPSKMKYGQSVTDACLGWENTVQILEKLALAVRTRRKLKT